MKKFLITFTLFVANLLYPDTTIVAFNNVHQFFGNSGNLRTVIDTINFPNSNENFSEIFMNINLECPNGGCDPWDRKANVLVKQFNQWFEIGRYVTPYGIGCGWTYDVTDYRSILKGDVELKSYIDTWVQPGWLVNIEFDFISGTPLTPNTSLRNIWNYDYVVYGDSTNPVNISTVEQYVPEDVQYIKFRITTTGHGQGNTENAAEFSYKNHEIIINNENPIIHDFWRDDCEYNDCSPQFGTWQYDRAGFCPGDKVTGQDFNLSNFYIPGEIISMDYVLEDYFNECSPNNPNCVDGQTCSSCDYNNNGHTEPFYFIGSHLIIYSEKYHSNADNYIYLIEQDSLTNEIQIYFENNKPVYGIQLNIDVSSLVGDNLNDIEFYSSSGGRAEEYDWTFSINNNGLLIGLSQELGTPIPPGEGLLTAIEWNGNQLNNLSGELNISNVEISGYFGSILSCEIGESVFYQSNLQLNEKDDLLLRRFLLKDPYPNPFNPFLNIEFEMLKPDNISLSIYNLKGNLISKLIENKNTFAGIYNYKWDSKYNSSGVYFVIIEGNNNRQIKKIILLK